MTLESIDSELPRMVQCMVSRGRTQYYLNSREILLKNPKFAVDAFGVLRSITGVCTNTLDNGSACKNTRQIMPQDAWQCALCVPCMKLQRSRKIAERRKQKRKIERLKES